ncbi:MAG: hypothetical protein PF495_18475 [Spirochaetales bacterium]|jgi:hypothetical protein|nr:hypothetical protein [Spirochaetales bacterium]
MRQTTFPSAIVSRHYLQIAQDFEKLLVRIEQSTQQKPSPVMTVVSPAQAFADWHVLFTRHQSVLPRVFCVLSERVLARTGEIRLVDTVRYLVPLEERVYKILHLRDIISRHKFSGEWQTGQHLFIKRIDKVIDDLTAILAFFIAAVAGAQEDQQPRQLVWAAGIDCQHETQEFLQWYHAIAGAVSWLDYPVQTCRVLMQKMNALWRSRQRTQRSPLLPTLVVR